MNVKVLDVVEIAKKCPKKNVLHFARTWMLHVVLIIFVIDVPFRSTKWEKANSGGDTFHESRPGSFEGTLRTRKSND